MVSVTTISLLLNFMIKHYRQKMCKSYMLTNQCVHGIILKCGQTLKQSTHWANLKKLLVCCLPTQKIRGGSVGGLFFLSYSRSGSVGRLFFYYCIIEEIFPCVACGDSFQCVFNYCTLFLCSFDNRKSLRLRLFSSPKPFYNTNHC